jgi:hypothetical protein
MTSRPGTIGVRGVARIACAAACACALLLPALAQETQAAETLCRGKGFQGGKSLDTQSELKCPAKILLERRTPSAGECPTEIFVTRAMCQ